MNSILAQNCHDLRASTQVKNLCWRRQDSGDGSKNLVIVSGVSFELDIKRVEIKSVLNSVCSGAAHSVIQHRFSLNLIDVCEFERNNETKGNFLIFQGIKSKYDNFPISLIPIL